MLSLPADWHQTLFAHGDEEILQQLDQKLSQASNDTVYPPRDQLFRAFELTPLASVKVVILGQDPYHGEGQAHGLSFSVPAGIRPPPSLNNIFKACAADLGMATPPHGDLSAWATQGVLLLNTTLSVAASQPLSHAKWGWQTLTDHVITTLNQQTRPIVFLLWGKHAQQKQTLIHTPPHCCLTAPHPSPLSAHRGFFNARHFSAANAFLERHHLDPIEWARLNRRPAT